MQTRNPAPHIAGSFICVAVKGLRIYTSPVFEYPRDFADMQYFLRETFDELACDKLSEKWGSQTHPKIVSAVNSLFDSLDAVEPRYFANAAVKGPFGVSLFIAPPCLL